MERVRSRGEWPHPEEVRSALQVHRAVPLRGEGIHGAGRDQGLLPDPHPLELQPPPLQELQVREGQAEEDAEAVRRHVVEGAKTIVLTGFPAATFSRRLPPPGSGGLQTQA